MTENLPLGETGEAKCVGLMRLSGLLRKACGGRAPASGAFERGVPGVPSRGGEVLSVFRVHTAAAHVAGHANR